MEAKDLRIGNYVMLKNLKTTLSEESESVIEVGPDTIYDFETNELYHTYKQELKPIPLTEEWLLKLGYTLVNITTHYKCFEGEPYVYLKKDNSIEMSTGNPLYFVHELQNRVFSLTGKELEYNG